MAPDDIKDLFSAFAGVTTRKMFGGTGIYHASRIIALEIDGEIWLKADAVSAVRFAAAGSRQWGYRRPDGKTVMMPYWSIPEDALDDPEAFAFWAKAADEAAMRAASGPKKIRS